MGVNYLSDEDIDSIVDTIKLEEQEDFRKRALKLANVKLQEGEIARIILQKAYLTFQSTPEISDEDQNKRVYQSSWGYLLLNETKDHADILRKLQSGKEVQGIENDPLDPPKDEIILLDQTLGIRQGLVPKA